MELSSRTVLLIGNEPTISLSIIKHYTLFNNKIIVATNSDALKLDVEMHFPFITTLYFNFYEENERLKLVDQLHARHLSPSCVIYNEFSISEGQLKYSKEPTFQEKVELYYSSITHLDECLIPFLETEADSKIVYVFPKIPWSPFKRRRILYIFKKMMGYYIQLLTRTYPNIRFFMLKYNFDQPLPEQFNEPNLTRLLQQRKWKTRFNKIFKQYLI